MPRRSPTLRGFELMFRQPSLGLAEVAWRWSFGFAAVIVALLGAREYLGTLNVTNSELLLLRTRQPALVSQAIARIFQGSGPRLFAALLVLGFGLGVVWVVVASVGRALTLQRIFDYFREATAPDNRFRMGSVAQLNVLRLVVTFASVLACCAALLLSVRASTHEDPAPGSVLLIFCTLTFFISMTWSFLNWLLSFSSVFAVAENGGGFRAFARAVDFIRKHNGAVLATGTWFGVSHLVLFVLASSVVAFPLAFAGVLPAGVVLGGVLLVTLLYFAAADFLYVGRLAALVAIVEAPPEAVLVSGPVIAEMPPPADENGRVDQDELILSDITN